MPVESAPVSVSEDTQLAVPLRNLIAIVVAVAMGTWGYFTLVERINNLENAFTKITYEQAMNSEFRIKWPRGEMGSLPDDARQDMRIEALTNKLEDMRGLDKELEVVRMRVGAIEDFANRPSRSAEHIKQVEIKIDYLTKELERLRKRYNK